jgi:hypothetical protein
MFLLPPTSGDSVNSTKSEYYPSITINDSMFVFTRRGEGFREDFFESTILADKKYTKSNSSMEILILNHPKEQ